MRESWLLDSGTWADIERSDTPKMGKYFLGIDLGENASMSCAAGFWPDTGALAAIGVFPEQPDLLTRGHNDGVGELYVRAAERGELYQAGELVSDPAELLRLALEQWGRPFKLVIDTWRKDKLKEILGNSEFPPTPIEVRRHGFLDGSADIREFRDAALDGHCSRSLRSCFVARSLRLGRSLTQPAIPNWSRPVLGGEGRLVTMQFVRLSSRSRLRVEWQIVQPHHLQCW